MRKVLLNTALIIMMMCGAMLLNQTAQASEWNKNNVKTVRKGAFTFKAYISKDGSKSWIYNVKINAGKDTSVLRFPAKTGKAKVTKIGHKENKKDSDICHNVFGSFVEWYHEDDGYSENIKNIKEIIIPNSVESITKYCFAGARNLKAVKLPKKLKKLDLMTFINSKGLTEITIPEKVTEVSPYAFDECKNIKRIKVSKNNKTYKHADGMLLSKDGRMLCLVPAAVSTVNIPDTVSIVDKWAFCQSGAEKIYIPESVADIRDDALTCKAKYVEISKENPVFAMDGECIYDKERKVLRAVVNADKNIVISDNVKIIPAGVSVIGKCAGYLEIPESVTTLDTPYWHRIADGINVVIKFRSAVPPEIITDIPSWEYAYFPVYSEFIIPKEGEEAYRKWLKDTDCEDIVKEIQTY